MSLFQSKKSADPEPSDALADGPMSQPEAQPEAPPQPPQPTPGATTAQLLFDGADAVALKLMNELQAQMTLSKEDRADFKMIIEWLGKSHRMRPKSNEELAGMGIDGIREFIAGEVQKELSGPPGTSRAKTERARRVAKGIVRRDQTEGSALAKALAR